MEIESAGEGAVEMMVAPTRVVEEDEREGAEGGGERLALGEIASMIESGVGVGEAAEVRGEARSSREGEGIMEGDCIVVEPTVALENKVGEGILEEADLDRGRGLAGDGRSE